MLYCHYYDRHSNSRGGEAMIGSDVIRGYSDTILLSLLAEGDSYGYQDRKSVV